MLVKHSIDIKTGALLEEEVLDIEAKGNVSDLVEYYVQKLKDSTK